MMTHQNSLVMKKIFCSLLTSAAVFTFAASASAAGLGGGAGMGANVGAGAGGNAGMDAPAGASVQAEGSAGVNANSSAGDHMSTEGGANQNSQVRPGATSGLDRAQERMSQMGSEHEQATEAEAASKPSVKARHKGKSTAKIKQ